MGDRQWSALMSRLGDVERPVGISKRESEEEKDEEEEENDDDEERRVATRANGVAAVLAQKLPGRVCIHHPLGS